MMQLTQHSFGDAVERGIAIIDWWAPWCGPCRTFGPIFEHAATKHPDILFAKVNTEAEPALAARMQIRSIPTVMTFRDGILVFAQPGLLPPAALDRLVQIMRDLDMDDVRRELAERRGAAATAR